ncbi:MAG: ribbon-helix-helix protein, CopG family [Deltaproteobacteria bacterium]|nr:ribbon-helix-helix protein, CopG family [Deltaproteobacteria bacterium]MBW2384061.1 ribbon-helix-helix protein, CopG family [Deltaproteobacteria bacterium]MBW2697260.1 ribbon-helix-helix protein, CopG family [Deltaproteobacteria bacterium]
MVKRTDATESAVGCSRAAPRKDRLVQARVPRELEASLKEEARRRRLSVSHLVRNVLEDALKLVDGVVHDVDRIVSDSVHLARSLGRGAERSHAGHDREASVGGRTREATREDMRGETADDLSHVYAWNEVVLHRPAACSSCGRALERGQRGYAGLSDEPGAARAWLCEGCVARL